MPKMLDLQLPTDSIPVQEENKVAWNSRRSAQDANFYTVGYTRRDIRQFLDILLQAGVATVIDIRHTPVSMYKPDFSKRNLASHLGSAGIDYVHIRELGVPRDIRGLASGGASRNPIWEWYDANVISGVNLHAFLNWADHPVALLCVELDPTACHRHRLALSLERRGLRGYDL